MKSNRTDNVSRVKKENNAGKQSKNTDIPDTDVLGMQQQDGETTANKIHGNSLSQKPAGKTGKNNLKTGKL